MLNAEQYWYSSFPTILQVEVTTKCNLRCTFCKVGAEAIQARGSMSFDTFERLLEQGRDSWKRVNLWGTGEPLLHPRLFDMAALARDRGINRIKVSTNGHALTRKNAEHLLESGVTGVRIALESAVASEYESVRVGASFELVVNGISELVAAKQRLKSSAIITLCSVVYEPMIAQSDVENLGRKLGVDTHELLPNIWREQAPNFPVALPTLRCSQQLEVFNVLANGDVIPCCHTYEGVTTIGSVHRADILDIWHGNTARKFRRQFVENRFPTCIECNYGKSTRSFMQ